MSIIWWIIIGIVILTIFHFIFDNIEQKKRLTELGGMQKLYSELINHILTDKTSIDVYNKIQEKYVKSFNHKWEDPSSKILKETSNFIALGVSGPCGSMIYTLFQTFTTVHVTYRFDSVFYGKHDLKWEFTTNIDKQSYMIKRIDEDVQNLINTII